MGNVANHRNQSIDLQDKQIICFYMIGNTGRYTAWKVAKCGVISSPYFPIFGLNTKIISKFPYSIQIPENTDEK